MKIVKLLLVVLVAFSLCGCSDDTNTSSNDKSSVAYVIGNVKNSRNIDLKSVDDIEKYLYDAAITYGEVFAIKVDGQSDIVFSEDLDIDENFKSASKKRLQMDAQEKTSNIIDELSQIHAEYPGVDYLEGIRIAANSLHNTDSNKKQMIVTGSLLSTTGILQFQNNLLMANPEDIVSHLSKENYLPDLTGIDVIIIGCGQVEEPQCKLSPKTLNNLKSIWRTILEESGANSVVFNDYIALESTDDRSDLPEVTCVEIPYDQPLSYDPEDIDLSQDALIVSESQVEFLGNTSEFADIEKSTTTLKPLADYLYKNQDKSIYLIGTTAGDKNTEFGIELSRKRAEAVKQLILTLSDIDGDRIQAKGLGSSNPWHIYNIPTDDPASSINRKCVIVDADSDIAEQLQNQGIL